MAEENIITALQSAQEADGYLTEETIEKIAEKFGATPAKVYGVATFYSQFRLAPVGKNVITVCLGTACHVNGGKDILDALSLDLKIKEGETTADGLFTLESAACLGCCSLSPVMTVFSEVDGDEAAVEPLRRLSVNGRVYGSLTENAARKIIKEIAENDK